MTKLNTGDKVVCVKEPYDAGDANISLIGKTGEVLGTNLKDKKQPYLIKFDDFPEIDGNAWADDGTWWVGPDDCILSEQTEAA